MGETLVTELIGDGAARQGARRLAAREFRPRRTYAAVLCAALAFTVGGAIAIEVIGRRTGRPVYPELTARIVAELRRLTWSAPAVLAVTGGVCALGALLFLLAVVPGRTRMEPLRSTDPSIAVAVRRRALRRSLTRAVLDVPGVGRARVRLRGRLRPRVSVRATTHYRNSGNLASMVRAAVNDRLDMSDPLRSRRIAVRLRWRRD